MYNEHIVYKKVKDFNDEQIRTIAIRYATTPYNFTSFAIASEFSRDGEYSIKPRTISNLIQKAIKNAIVSEEIALKIKEKAVYNASFYNKHSYENTLNKYTLLLKQRREFIENGYKHIKKKKEIHHKKETEADFVNRMKEEEKYLQNKITSLTYQINTYESYSDSEISLCDLHKELENTKLKLKNLQKYNFNK